MAEIRPFQGVRYNQPLVADLAAVICPIYDVTTPEMVQELYHRSEHNFIRLEHGRVLPRTRRRTINILVPRLDLTSG